MSTTLTPSATDIRTTWRIDPAHTQVEFAVRHLMISTVRGRFSDVSGSVSVPDGDFSRAEVEATIGVGSIDTREPQRDAHLVSPDFFDAQQFPSLHFKSRRVEPSPRDERRFVVEGDLTLHGVTRSVQLVATVEGQGRDPWGNERTGFSVTGKISRKEFGLTWNQLLETGGVAVGDEVKISIDTELVAELAHAA